MEFLAFSQTKILGSSLALHANGLGGSSATPLFSFLKIPAVALALRAWKQKGKKEGGWGEGIFALLRLRIERFRFPLIKRKPKQKIFHLLIKRKKWGAEKNKKCNEKISVLVCRSEAEASGNAPTELPLYRSVKLSSEPPRAPRVISRGSVQKKLEFQPKDTANLQFQSFWKFYAPAVRSHEVRLLRSFAPLPILPKMTKS